MRIPIVSLVIAGALLACGGDSPTSVSSQVALAQHEALWQHAGIHAYEFDFEEQKFGGDYHLHITVRGDTITNMIDNETGEPPLGPVSPWTIDSLFTHANKAITDDGLNVELEFNDQVGYPTFYAVSSKANNPGGPFSAKVSNFAASQ